MKTSILGSAVVITSAIKLDDLKLVKKYKPEALTVWEKDEDGVKEPVFSASVFDGEEGTINECGVVFGKANPDGFAQITMLVKAPADKDIKELVADSIGGGLMKLKAFEEYLPGVVDTLNAEHEAILGSIEVAG